ncbi:GIY-YIG nuclease family protein [Hutsoniella sourekii]|uniref:GIY-YIG nuclease family protein n=1 Tax=Hutsoniella sourekii TaxID=87650 RepID=UPI0004829984|nr:GIY-YIG nuclease family protein [Hutsoniella sourekii]
MADKKYYFYVLYCQDNTLYAGYTTDLKRREASHRSGKGAKYTKPAFRQPVRMIYAESWASKRLAMQQEYWFKKLSRKQKEEFLAYHGQNQLSEGQLIVVNRMNEEAIDANTKELP